MEENIKQSKRQETNIMNAIEIKCTLGNPANFICITEGCYENAIICNIDQCYCKKSKHIQCKHKMTVYQFINCIQNARMQKPKTIKTLMQNIIKTYDSMIEKLSEDRLQFIEYTEMFGFTKNMISFMRNVREDVSEQIKGDLAFKICMENKNKLKPYTPNHMTYYRQIKDSQVQIHFLLNNLIFQLLKEQQKKQVSALRFGLNTIETTSIQNQNRHMQFIPIQISSFIEISLKELNLSFNAIRKINNLQKLIYLENLRLQCNQISKIQGLNTLVRLQKLYLSDNKITKIQGLKSLNKLQYLSLGCNQIKIVDGLEFQCNLVDLRLYNNKIEDLQNFTHLKKLNFIDLIGNPISNTQKIHEIIKVIQKNGIKQLEQASHQNFNNDKIHYLSNSNILQNMFIFKFYSICITTQSIGARNQNNVCAVKLSDCTQQKFEYFYFLYFSFNIKVNI